MLTDRERQTWREIQRRLVENDDFLRSFHSAERRPPGDHLPMALTLMLLAGPTDIHLLRLFGSSVSTPPSGFTPSAAA